MDSQHSRLVGRRAATVALCETHFDRVFRYLVMRIGNLNEAQVLAGEVFIHALRDVEARQYAGLPLELRLFQFAQQVAADRWQIQSWRAPFSAAAAAAPYAGLARDNLAGILGQPETIRQIMPLLRQLEVARQEVLALRFGAGLNIEQIALVLGTDQATARELQRAALLEIGGNLNRAPGE